MSKTIYERIYERLEALGIDPAHLPEAAKSKAPGFMDLRAPNTMSYKKPQQIRQQARETKVS
jgi:hypothetical protein